jgi:diguanylate cyclase (GGDEF)-like protein
VGRWGGEEFLAVVANCLPEQLAAVAERFRMLVASSGLRQVQNLQVTISVGATRAEPSDTVESLVKRADSALFRAKETGRNKVVFVE